MPESFEEYQLLQALPGYMREDLMAEDADFVRDALTYVQAEATEAKKQRQKAEAQGR